MKKEKENLRESKLTCNINLYKIKSAEMFAEFISNEEEEFYMISAAVKCRMTVRSAPDVEPAYIQEHRKIRIRREDHSREIRRGRHTATEIHRETTERIMAIHR